ncbi:hypothetical protein BDR06DRAFT_973948 [Suillus hirtellus]|nr:hypothetical protein BDR06DRAFT_973948 [Suillus hirtellus]
MSQCLQCTCKNGDVIVKRPKLNEPMYLLSPPFCQTPSPVMVEHWEVEVKDCEHAKKLQLLEMVLGPALTLLQANLRRLIVEQWEAEARCSTKVLVCEPGLHVIYYAMKIINQAHQVIYFKLTFWHMGQPQLYKTDKDRAEAVCGHWHAYYACQCHSKSNIVQGEKGGQHNSDASLMPSAGLGRWQCMYHTPEEKIEAAHFYMQVYYEHHHEHIRVKTQENCQVKPKNGYSNKKCSCWMKKCDEIDACLQVLIGPSSTKFVKGLHIYFISNPNSPNSLDVMQGAIDCLKDLHQRAETEVESVIEECRTGCDLNHTQDSIFRICWVLTAVEDLLFHARLGEDKFVEAMGSTT